MKNCAIILCTITIGGSRGACWVHATPYGTQFFHFCIHFHQKVPMSKSTSPPNGCTPPLREILDPPLITNSYHISSEERCLARGKMALLQCRVTFLFTKRLVKYIRAILMDVLMDVLGSRKLNDPTIVTKSQGKFYVVGSSVYLLYLHPDGHTVH